MTSSPLLVSWRRTRVFRLRSDEDELHPGLHPQHHGHNQNMTCNWTSPRGGHVSEFISIRGHSGALFALLLISGHNDMSWGSTRPAAPPVRTVSLGSPRVPVRPQGLAQLEILCKQLYETTDTAVRHQAEKALVEFTNSPDCLSKCQLLLERGSVSTGRDGEQ